MARFFTFLSVFCGTLGGVKASVINRDLTTELASDGTSSQTALAVRAEASLNTRYFATKEFKEWVPNIDFTTTPCKGAAGHEALFKPLVSPAPDFIKIKTCFDRPLAFISPAKDNIKFTLDDSCSPGITERWTARIDTTYGGLDAPDKTEDVLIEFEAAKCVTRERDCWGRWINKPEWEYEWVVQIPHEVHDKYVKDGECGKAFHEAVRDSCADPGGYQTTLYACGVTPFGFELRFRHNLLCGKTRIEDAISRASGGELKYSCPHFVEVPVPA